MRSDASTSDGFMVLLPAGMIVKFSFRNIIVPSGVPGLVSRSTRPLFFSKLKNRDAEGWRRSASTSTTLRPEDIAEIARLTAIVVFPSPGREDVTWMTLGGRSTSDIWIPLRKLRIASLKG